VLAKTSKAKFDWFSALQLQTEKLAYKTFGVDLCQLIKRDSLTVSSAPKVASLLYNHLLQETAGERYLFTVSPDQKRSVELRRVLESEVRFFWPVCWWGGVGVFFLVFFFACLNSSFVSLSRSCF
jgi:hypothetical protein